MDTQKEWERITERFISQVSAAAQDVSRKMLAAGCTRLEVPGVGVLVRNIRSWEAEDYSWLSWEGDVLSGALDHERVAPEEGEPGMIGRHNGPLYAQRDSFIRFSENLDTIGRAADKLEEQDAERFDNQLG